MSSTLRRSSSPARHLKHWMLDGHALQQHADKQRTEPIELSAFISSGRVRTLHRPSTQKQARNLCGPVLYWMVRDHRSQDNWAALYAQSLAREHKRPLIFCYCVPQQYLDATYRQFHFMIGGLKELWKDLKKLNIPFEVLLGTPDQQIPKTIKDLNISHLVTDFLPIRPVTEWIKSIIKKIPSNVAFDQVDAHNVIPCWITSDHQEYAAYTIRPKIKSLLDQYLVEFPALMAQSKSWVSDLDVSFVEPDWQNILEEFINVDRGVSPCALYKPGTKAAFEQLAKFLKSAIHKYADERNNPTKPDSISNLSPWISFGNISMQRCVMVMKEVKKCSAAMRHSVDVFIEEAVVRRELADNFCFYQPNYYDSIKGSSQWAYATLIQHKDDKRDFTYKLSQFESAATHDPLWNAAQRQLVDQGKMHGFMRMYWAKKILEWTNKPETALQFAFYLNDKYSLDGCVPNGYVGVMWSVCGVHDRAFKDRLVIGKIRPMTFQGCKRKFDIQAYINKYDPSLTNEDAK